MESAKQGERMTDYQVRVLVRAKYAGNAYTAYAQAMEDLRRCTDAAGRASCQAMADDIYRVFGPAIEAARRVAGRRRARAPR